MYIFIPVCILKVFTSYLLHTRDLFICICLIIYNMLVESYLSWPAAWAALMETPHSGASPHWSGCWRWWCSRHTAAGWWSVCKGAVCPSMWASAGTFLLLLDACKWMKQDRNTQTAGSFVFRNQVSCLSRQLVVWSSKCCPGNYAT